MNITASEMRRICPSYPPERIDDDVRVFNTWAHTFGITNPLRVVHFIAQVAHESGGFRYVEELASGEQYEGRKDLGNTSPGDGKKYKGRGYIQITGKANYIAYRDSKFCVGDVVEHPEWLCNAPGRMKSAMWYWWRSGCNRLADKDDIRTITKRINGGLNGLSDRQYYYRKAKRILML